jgi:hypothetical protein
MNFRHFTYLFITILFFASTSCRKEKLLSSGGELRFSTDTLLFDTVFTAYASFTLQMTLLNPQSQKINVSSVRLEKGEASYFRINVDGRDGNDISNIEIAANDSIHIFATVNIDPTNENTPFVVQDRLIATLNGKEFSVPLIAFGQNAYYIVNERLKTQTFKTDKPYVIIRSAQVDSNETLTIPAGCRIYMNADSRLFVYGTLKVNGTKTDSVIFQGDRLDRKYFANKDFPGEWGGLYFFSSSTNNEINYAVLKNCGNNAFGAVPAAIQLEPDLINDQKAQLVMHNTVIANSIGHGIVAFGGTLIADNCLVHTCGAQALAFFEGGGFNLTNCTFGIYPKGDIEGLKHLDNPAVALLNYRDINEVQYVSGSLVGTMTNCIIWGSLETELFCNKKGNGLYTVQLNNCLYKSKDKLIDSVRQESCIQNQDPLFEDYNNWNYRLKAGSPAINKGVTVAGVTDRDLDGKVRSGIPDLGCYERE